MLRALAAWVDHLARDEPESTETRELLGEVALRVADLHHRLGHRRRAAFRYDQAIAWLPEGASRARARYRGAQLAQGTDALEEELRDLVGSGGESRWDRLARVDVRMIDLRTELGLRTEAPPAEPEPIPELIGPPLPSPAALPEQPAAPKPADP